MVFTAQLLTGCTDEAVVFATDEPCSATIAMRKQRIVNFLEAIDRMCNDW